MKQVFIKQGNAVLEDVPSPIVEKGRILVEVFYSCISIGTELSGLKGSAMPLWKRALKNPDNIKKVIDNVKNQGINKTKHLITNKKENYKATGYSVSGKVIGVGEDIKDIKVGDHVACAGAQYAYHAEIVSVPRNMLVKLNENIDLKDASTVTLGAIALQGVRRGSPTIGETFVVIGLGILGQITTQILKANGCRVIGIDLDNTRVDLGISNGLDVGIYSENGEGFNQVERLTGGVGADGVIITAASPSDSVISTAFKMCRKKGRVVLVGDVGLNLNRSDFYQKEIDLFISSSYGPGRYDNNYEEIGLDYPLAYVRWTENRNMEEYIRMLSEKKVILKDLITDIYEIEKAAEAFNTLNSANKPLMVLLKYNNNKIDTRKSKINHNYIGVNKNSSINLAVVGAGSFAKGTHLPNILEMQNHFHLSAIMSRTGHNAAITAKQYAAEYSTTDFKNILNDNNVDAILIASRHNLHGDMVLSALEANKHVLVEKPLTLNEEDLNIISSFYSKKENLNAPILLTGFNRRFSPIVQKIKKVIDVRSNPIILNYTMNAGYIPLDHWVHTSEGGGRNIGEACHIYDLFTFLIGTKYTSIKVNKLTPKTNYYTSKDNFIVSIEFEDGSIANLTYTALGSKEFSKEKLELYVDGKVIVMDDYKTLDFYGAKIEGMKSNIANKGHKEELIRFAEVIKDGGEWPIPLWQQIQAMEISFAVEEKLEL